jgi:tRNA-dihydrouridine synthase
MAHHAVVLCCLLLRLCFRAACRKGYYDNTDIAHTIIPQMPSWGAAAVTLHGRSRQQRYSRAADWEYIQ